MKFRAAELGLLVVYWKAADDINYQSFGTKQKLVCIINYCSLCYFDKKKLVM